MKRAILILLVLSIPTIIYLIKPGYSSMHDDLHIMRLFEMERCLAEGQIPCRWAPDMAWGYGQPMFNFYSTFPYYLGAFIRLVTPLSIIATSKLLFIIALLASGIGMYLLAKQFWGKMGGLVSAVLYLYAPYHALDIYVRGALSESFALAILPFLFLAFYKLIQKPTIASGLFVTFSLAALLMTHNISTMLYTPFTIIWVLYWLVRKRVMRAMIPLFVFSILGIGLASSFIIPATIEQSLIQKEFLTQDYYEYESHFVSIRQILFDRSWKFGASTYGPNDDLSLQYGWPYWWLFLPLGLLTLLKLRHKDTKALSLIVLLLFFSLLTLYMSHLKSLAVWKLIPPLSYVQFPWRLYGPSLFFLSLASGSLSTVSKWAGKVVGLIIIVLAIVLNFSYFRPEHIFSAVTDNEKLSGVLFELQQQAAILDYLPQTARSAPKEKAPTTPILSSGDASFNNFTVSSNRFFFDVEVYSPAQIQVPVTYYPGWRIIIQNNIVPVFPTGDLGLVTLDLTPGTYMVQGRFEDTRIRTISNSLSLLSFAVVISIILYKGASKGNE